VLLGGLLEVLAGGLDQPPRPVHVGEQLAATLADHAVHDDGVDVGHVGAQRHRGDRVLHRHHVEVPGVDEHHVGLLAGRQRTGAILDPGDVRAVDGGHLEHLPGGEHGVRDVGVGLPAHRVDPGALGAERGAHLGEHVTGDGGDDVDGQAGTQPELVALVDRRPPVAHLQLDLWRDGDLAAGLGDPLPLVVAEVAAVDVRRVRAEQAEPVELLDHGEPPGQAAHAHVHRDREAQLPGELPLGGDDVVLAEAGAAGGQGHGEQAAVGGEVGAADAADVVGRDDLGAVEPVLGQRGVGAAVRVLGPDADLLQRADGGVRVVRGVVDVGPVDQGGDAGVEALQRTGQVGVVDVLGPVDRGVVVQYAGEVVVQGRVGRAPADRGLPGVPVGVDEARDHDEAGSVDDLGIGADLRLHGGDPVVLDEDVAARQVADVRVHGHDDPATDEGLAHGGS
jgi:hypothetical protein